MPGYYPETDKSWRDQERRTASYLTWLQSADRSVHERRRQLVAAHCVPQQKLRHLINSGNVARPTRKIIFDSL